MRATVKVRFGGLVERVRSEFPDTTDEERRY
jgi:hypothetical protein